MAVAEAAGGNGVTENALSVLDQMIAQLQEQGVDPAKIAQLEKLSQAGHKIKAIQKQIEAKCLQQGFKNDLERYNFLNNPANSIVVNGKTMKLLDAARLLSLEGSSSVYTSATLKEIYIHHGDSISLKSNYDYSLAHFEAGPLSAYDNIEVPPIFNFMLQLREVENSGLLSNPTLSRLVKEDLSRQIFNSSDQTLLVPTHSDVAALVQTTQTSSNAICSLANAVTCQDRAG